MDLKTADFYSVNKVHTRNTLASFQFGTVDSSRDKATSSKTRCLVFMKFLTVGNINVLRQPLVSRDKIILYNLSKRWTRKEIVLITFVDNFRSLVWNVERCNIRWCSNTTIIITSMYPYFSKQNCLTILFYAF